MHQPVLLQEVIDTLDIKNDDVVVDATFGGGGHSKAALEKLGPHGVLIAIDTDKNALESQKKLCTDYKSTVHLKQSNFRDLDVVLNELGVTKVDKFIFDLGFSSTQLEEGERGLSFKKDEPLLMTLTDVGSITEETLTARRIVNEWNEEHIETIIRCYGEEGFSRQIAKAIVEARANKEIETTTELREIILRATPFWYHKKRIDPATRTFQALRIAVNDEIETARIGILKAFSYLTPGGAIAVITFHSTEDRVVKRLFRSWKEEELGRQEPKKPIKPSREEIKGNPRARSAKLRIFLKNK
ncbi:16S rRNA (cytosine(1402)-N(4))-methyltransferase RsmH [Candidatus Kaiserbacteria bacterium]|nr:16S rRNA (cytosine(1402)-N(4))-methyltransferase RsmH [Candidatus Kaiserbacteria bacterium]